MSLRDPLRRRRAFSLTELLFVIAIIGIVIALLLPAVHRVRESAARVKCANNLKQVGLACHMVDSIYLHLPTGGWGYLWVGDATRPSGPSQPGGWIFQVLPFVEQESVFNLAVSRAGVVQMVGTPLGLFNCSSRRTGGPYQHTGTYCNYGGSLPTGWLAATTPPTPATRAPTRSSAGRPP
jgi:prepilin-type N-terminal cleavage/methylation domain-containing protein